MTDGVTEAMDDRERMFGVEGMTAFARMHAGASPEALVAGLGAAVTAFAAGVPTHDDITILTLRYLGAGKGGE